MNNLWELKSAVIFHQSQPLHSVARIWILWESQEYMVCILTIDTGAATQAFLPSHWHICGTTALTLAHRWSHSNIAAITLTHRWSHSSIAALTLPHRWSHSNIAAIRLTHKWSHSSNTVDILTVWSQLREILWLLTTGMAVWLNWRTFVWRTSPCVPHYIQHHYGKGLSWWRLKLLQL